VEGRVLIDHHDLRDVQLKSLRDQIALVLQEPFLFPLSIAENIAYGRPAASRAEIETPPALPMYTSSLRVCPKATIRLLASAAPRCPAANANASRLRGRC